MLNTPGARSAVPINTWRPRPRRTSIAATRPAGATAHGLARQMDCRARITLVEATAKTVASVKAGRPDRHSITPRGRAALAAVSDSPTRSPPSCPARQPIFLQILCDHQPIAHLGAAAQESRYAPPRASPYFSCECRPWSTIAPRHGTAICRPFTGRPTSHYQFALINSRRSIRDCCRLHRAPSPHTSTRITTATRALQAIANRGCRRRRPPPPP